MTTRGSFRVMGTNRAGNDELSDELGETNAVLPHEKLSGDSAELGASAQGWRRRRSGSGRRRRSWGRRRRTSRAPTKAPTSANAPAQTAAPTVVVSCSLGDRNGSLRKHLDNANLALDVFVADKTSISEDQCVEMSKHLFALAAASLSVKLNRCVMFKPVKSSDYKRWCSSNSRETCRPRGGDSFTWGADDKIKYGHTLTPCRWGYRPAYSANTAPSDMDDNPKGRWSNSHGYPKPDHLKCRGRKMVSMKDADGTRYTACVETDMFKAMVCADQECGVAKRCLVSDFNHRGRKKSGSWCKKGNCENKSKFWWSAVTCTSF